MFTRKYDLRWWWRDLSLVFSQLCRGVLGKVHWRDSKNLITPKLESQNVQASQSWLGPSLLVKGEISGNEDLLIDGSVEGVVRLTGRKLSVGPTATVKAEVIAGEAVISGNVRGNLRVGGQIVVTRDGSVIGDLITPQVFIEDGAWFKGSVEIEKTAVTECGETALSESESTLERVKAVAAGLKGT